MKVCYQHFPIVTVLYDGGKTLKFKHYLGEIEDKVIHAKGETTFYKIDD